MNQAAVMLRNARYYRFYSAFSDIYAWVPVFFLYFSEHLPLARVLQLEALYYACVVILEVPSGYFSDVVGRKPTLLIYTLAFIFAYSLFLVGGSFLIFAIAQFFLAVGISFRSGTDTAFHYDSLAAANQAECYASYEAKIVRNQMLAGSFGSLAGGFLGLIALKWAYGLTLAGILMTLPLVLAFREPPREQGACVSFPKQLADCATSLKNPVLGWVFGFAVLAIILEHIPYEFYQPWLDLLGQEDRIPHTTVASGMVMAVSMLLAAGAAAYSIKLRDRFGLSSLLLIAAGIQILIIFTMGRLLHPLVIGLIVLRSLPMGLAAAPVNAAIAPRVARARRATFLSLQSLAGRLAFSGVLTTLSFLAEPGQKPDWPALQIMTGVAAAIGLAGLILLALTARNLNRDGS